MTIPSLHRINELSRKQKTEGLSQEEYTEQQQLRQEYLQAIRGQVLSTMSTLKVVDPNGEDVTPEKLKITQKQNTSKLH
ncbi:MULTISPECIES: DUF896 domain-containing protein [Paenibacillus]|uniref:DUF896 domain-containing protein n=1 Tax=Paenibacillus TaxID=44249 RepID=UPI0002071CB2|nr:MULTISPECIES: DUF896 domain-containing protein [Paenibacillus]EGG37397.1 hypothetical protein HMPREF9412_0540 [Paenibacillus sp. HGF5]PCL92918.1 DUF896 family protein [Paenibacillus lautus]QOT12473.1 DUF896 domain-containing protein [Paenibacillus sp. JNUCC-32]WFB61468.1 DUF896 domain-containing protein [Paenibacillus sp. BR1-192]GIP02956.1 UPF0291 protein YnzC [Paenibacillus lautus]